MESLLLPLLLVVLLVPMFLAMRRQKREMAQTTEMQSNLKVGDRVVMTSGIQGIIVELDDDSLDLEIAVDVVTTWTRAAVRQILADDHFDAEPAEESAPAETTPAEESAKDTEIRLNKD